MIGVTETTTTSTTTTTTLAPAITGNVYISQLKYEQNGANEDEFVDVTNCDSIPVDISDWTIRSVIGDMGFIFPAGTVLNPGDTARIWSHVINPADPAYDGSIMNFSLGETTFSNNTYIWNNTDDQAELLDSMGGVADAPPAYTNSDDSPIMYSCPP